MKKIVSLLMVLLMVLSLAACGAASKPDAEVPQEMENGIQSEMAEDSASAPNVLPENRKLIRTVRLEAETKDLEALLGQLESRIGELGGYIQSRNQYHGSESDSYRYRSAEMTIRIPAEKADQFIAKVESASNLVTSSETLEDVTLDYVATESRMKALQTEEARLLEMLAESGDMADLLAIEARLTEVRGELETITSQMRTYDNLIDYTTIYLQIYQVQQLTQPEPETFWQRVSRGLSRNMQGLGENLVDFAVWLIVSLPYLVPAAAIVVLLVILRKRRKKKKLQKQQKTEE